MSDIRFPIMSVRYYFWNKYHRIKSVGYCDFLHISVLSYLKRGRSVDIIIMSLDDYRYSTSNSDKQPNWFRHILLSGKKILVYLDNTTVMAAMFKEHFRLLREVFTCYVMLV